MTLFHLAEPAEWEAAGLDSAGSVAGEGFYEPSGFAREGFIHLSSAEQVGPTYGRYYSGRTDLVRLTVDESHESVAPHLIWESLVGGELFPHLYVRLAVEAVSEVEPGWTP
jgi:uncharacterized protein (DUF952 family)